jgi:hypothetical protein
MAYKGSSREATKPRVTSWSFSALKTYQQCPFKLKCSRIDKLPEPQSPQMLEGQRIHKLAEDYLNGAIAEVPEELKLFGDDYRDLRQYGSEAVDGLGHVFAEYGAAFREDLSICEWWAKDAWLRVKLDALVLNYEGGVPVSAVVVDLKTGKPRRDDKDQLSLFAFGVMLLYPTVEEVRSELWYCAGGELVNGVHLRSGFEHLKKEWLDKAAPMLADEEFLPTPNGLCSWCAFSKLKGGPCTMA